MIPPLSLQWNGEAFRPHHPKVADKHPVIDNEMWMTCLSAPSYSVSSLGRVRREALTYGGGGSVRKPHGVLSQRALATGHMLVTLSENNQRKHALVHRLVAEAFLGAPSQDRPFACHIDDNPKNNHVENIYWGSRIENAADALRNGRTSLGEHRPNSKLLKKDIALIVEASVAGETQRSIAKRFGISQSNVSLIVNGGSWRHSR